MMTVQMTSQSDFALVAETMDRYGQIPLKYILGVCVYLQGDRLSKMSV